MTRTQQIASTFKHALVYGASGILSRAIGFIMLPFYAHLLRGEGYGMIGMIDVVLSVLTLFVGYGVQGAMGRFYYERKTVQERNELISTGLIVMFSLVISVTLPCLIFNEQIARLAFGKDGLGYFISLAALTFIFNMTSHSAEAYILIRQKSIIFSLLSILKLTLGLSFNIYFIVHLKMGVLGYLYSGLIVSILFTVVTHSYTYFHVGLHFVKEDAKAILGYCLPLLPGYIAMFIRTNTNRVLLRSFLGLSQLGTFEMLFKFATLIGFFVGGPFFKIWGMKRLEIADTGDGPSTIAKVYTLHLSISFFVGIVLSLEIPILLKILTPEEFWLNGWVVILAVFSRIIMINYYHFYFGLIYAKQTYKISIVQIAATVVNLILALILIKPFGIVGAVLVSCLSNLFQCGFAYYMAKPYYEVPYEWGKIVFIVGWAFIVYWIINFVSLSEISGIENWLNGNIKQTFESVMISLNLDRFRDGKLVVYTLKNIPLLVDGSFKLLLSFIFIAGLIGGNIFPRKKFVEVCAKASK